MTSVASAIREAVRKGDYDSRAMSIIALSDRFHREIRLCVIFLDPLFWQALGKAKGWEGHDDPWEYGYDDCWRCRWHVFIDHLAAGKDVESFFASL